MSAELADRLDFKLAWRRVKRDISQNRVFIQYPHEVALIEQDLDGWLERLEKAVRSSKNTYTPSAVFICEVPKAGAGIRPGAHISIEDRVLYAACLQAAYEQIFNKLEWAQGTVDYNYQLIPPETEARSFFKSQFVWPKFNQDTRTKIESGASYVVMTDICGYYENVNLSLLRSDLRSIEVPRIISNQIHNLLKIWADPTSGEGIPQGHSPSDLLGKLYLDYVDRHLCSEGIDHIRWVDDYRIFCRSLTEARNAIKLLIRLLRERGLNLQSAKTRILRANQALDEVSRVENQLRPLIERLRESAVEFIVEEDDPYMPIYRIDEIFSENPDYAPIDAIKQAFRVYFIESLEGDKFDKTFFRFLLKRLRSVRDQYAVEYCKGIFVSHPQETRIVLAYFEDVGAYYEVEQNIVDFLNSEDAIYPYQKYQIISWLCSLEIEPSEALLTTVRNIVWGNMHSPQYLRLVCWDFIGKFGVHDDLERTKNSYSGVVSQHEQMEIICALGRMERSRRNEFFGIIREESELHGRAVNYIKSIY